MDIKVIEKCPKCGKKEIYYDGDWRFDLDNGFSSPVIKFCPFCGKVLRRYNAMRITEIISILERELQLHGDVEVWRRSDHGDDPLLSDFNLNSPDDLYEEATEYAPNRLLL